MLVKPSDTQNKLISIHIGVVTKAIVEEGAESENVKVL